MSGSKSWSSQSGVNSLSVEVSDLPAAFKKKPVQPKPWGKNDVHYSLTWDLDAAPVGQIERETGGRWYDVTGIDQDVLPGVEIKLRGLAAPRSMDTAAGRWAISNWKTVAPVKGFEASTDGILSLPIALTPDLGKKELTLQFCGVGETEVTYTTKAGGQEVTAKVKFKVKKPASARAFPHSKAGQDTNEYPEWDICSETGR